MRTLHLREWTTTAGVELTTTQRDELRTRFRATVEPTIGISDRYDVTPGDIVGAIRVDEAVILVEPKLPISRVLFLLGYAADPYGWREEHAQLGELPDLVTGVAALFAELCDRALHCGLLAGYHDVDDELTTVRG